MINMVLLLHAILGGACGWAFAGVLKEPGMLLYPLYNPVYLWVERRFGPVEELYWWKPIWGCSVCVATWWGMVTYLAHGGRRLDELSYAAVLSLLTSLLLNRYAV